MDSVPCALIVEFVFESLPLKDKVRVALCSSALLRALDMDAMTVASDAVTPLRELVIIREHESAFVAKNLMQSNSVDALPVQRRQQLFFQATNRHHHPAQ